MRSYPALEGLRIGCVQYLNAKPLIHTYSGPVQMDHPSQLARDLAAGELDAALVPVFEALGSRHYVLVDDVGIASDGAVFSVFLAYRGKLADIRRIALDPASLTSIHLLQVLLAEFHGLRPECVDARVAEKFDAQLLIGNQAMAFRESMPSDMQLLDLGEEWKKQTGLPFVYALWVLREGLSNVANIASAFRELKRDGTAQIDVIADSEESCSPELARRYLTQHIRFDLRSREKAAMIRFRELLAKHGFLTAADKALEFV
ncbi:menaquinone biosynthetic enzyme MqnA/MqnD family protein [Verrucomicrobiota bacterium sgz303538]